MQKKCNVSHACDLKLSFPLGLFIYFEGECAERDVERENSKQDPHCQGKEPEAGLKLMNL